VLLRYRPPFDEEHLTAFLAARAIRGVERVNGSGYARVLRLSSGPSVLRTSTRTRDGALALQLPGASAAERRAASAHARRVFDLDADPSAIARVLRRSPLLRPLVDRRPGLRIPGAWDAFECAVRAVLGQQVSVAAGLTFVSRVVARCGSPLDAPRDGLTHAFPTADAVAAADLSGLGLTAARAASLRALARAASDGRVRFGAPPDEVREALVSLPGIGPWTAEYVALRGIGDRDAFPAGDLVLRRVAAGAGAPLAARELAALAEAWRPFRGYAVLYLWDRASSPGPPRNAGFGT
jgi:AraC family transcriptional regulator of adaptative response / DNA-3-methyladenine glycosylase II